MYLTPRKQKFLEIIINFGASFLAGLIGSITIVLVTFFLSDFFSGDIDFGKNSSKNNSIFPFIISFISLIGTSISAYLTYIFLNISDPQKYRKTHSLLSQLGFFQILTYIFFLFIYILLSRYGQDYLLLSYLIQILISTLGISLIIETLNSQKYFLVGFYGSFIAFLFIITIILFIFINFGLSFSKIIILLFSLPIMNGFQSLFKNLFEYFYALYYQYYTKDTIGEIFDELRRQEEKKAFIEEQKNNL